MNLYRTRLTYLSLSLRNWVSLVTLVGSIFFAGCVQNETPYEDSSPTAEMKESGPIVSPYIDVTVEDVEIRFLETHPVQVMLVIHGTLPDQCKYDFYSVENRGEMSVKISLKGIHPGDLSCLQTSQIIEYELLLGSDMLESERGFAPGEYKLIVNEYETTFFVKE